MKSTVCALVAGVLLSLALARNASAQDAMKPGPGMKVLADTTLIRAVEVTLQPKEKTGAHSHPAHFMYALTAGKIVVHYTDGKDETWDLKAGDSAFGDPERPHVTENVGSTPMKLLLVELKEHPYKAPK
jgi:quercetin dioxygenase-like cupin family protein